MDGILLTDYVSVHPDKRIISMSRDDKVRFMDSVLNPMDESKRGLRITLDLSHAGKRINNRIYTTWGQRDGVESLLKPFPKPILRHHQTEQDAIGRVVDGRYFDLTHEAAQHVSRSNDIMLMHQSFENRDYKKLADSLHRTGVLMNPRWPGLGKMQVTAKISDKDAVEKFLDGRYLNFSGGSSTDKAICSVCIHDWVKGPCEHRPGEVVDGKAMVLMCGRYTVREVSVVNEPADDLSSVTSMEVTDFVMPESVKSFLLTDKEALIITDSVINSMEESLEPEDKTEVAPETASQESQTDTVEEPQVAQEEKVEDNQSETVTPKVEEAPIAEVTQPAIDWLELELAYQDQLGEKRIKLEDRKKLADEVFVGDNRTLPVTTFEQLDALMSAISMVCGEDAAVVEMITLRTHKPKALLTQELGIQNQQLLDKLQSLQEDYANALNQVESLKSNLAKALSVVADNAQKDFSQLEGEDSLRVMWDWFESFQETSKESAPATTIKQVDNPSIASTHNTGPKVQLRDYEQQTVDEYKKLKASQGEKSAEIWFERIRKRYSPKGFHPKNF